MSHGGHMQKLIGPDNKWLVLWRRHFQTHLLRWKLLDSDNIISETCSQGVLGKKSTLVYVMIWWAASTPSVPIFVSHFRWILSPSLVIGNVGNCKGNTSNPWKCTECFSSAIDILHLLFWSNNARDRKTFSVSLGLCEGIHPFPGFPTKRVMRSCGFSLMSFSTNRSVFWETGPLFDGGVYMLLSKRIHAEWKRSRQCVTVSKFTSL